MEYATYILDLFRNHLYSNGVEIKRGRGIKISDALFQAVETELS